jgi:hypothetical protein
LFQIFVVILSGLALSDRLTKLAPDPCYPRSTCGNPHIGSCLFDRGGVEPGIEDFVYGMAVYRLLVLLSDLQQATAESGYIKGVTASMPSSRRLFDLLFVRLPGYAKHMLRGLNLLVGVASGKQIARDLRD